jgi:3-oxoacyl-[acyl-carrier protein] reductase
MDLQLKGQRALVTGGSRGIGRAIVEALAGEGARVALCARGQAGVDEAVAAARAAGASDVRGQAFDVRDGAALAAFAQHTAAEWGGLDIVVSNVSTRPDSKAVDERWRQAFEADLLQHVRLAEATLPLLEAGRQPCLVFIASIASVMTQLLPEEVAYGALKAGLVNYAGALAERHGPRGVRVNTVSPGPIDFEGGAWDHYRQHKPKLYEMVQKLSALGRFGVPGDVARAVTFLVSPAASYITGANLRIDGGTLKSTNF